MNVTFITPAPFVKRLPIYHIGGRLYGNSNAITGPLILAGIAKRAGHHVEAYEELNGAVPYKRLLRDTDVLCVSAMTSNAPRAYELAKMFHEEGHARVLMGGMHPSYCPEEATRYADQVMVGEGEGDFLDVLEGRNTNKIVACHPVDDLDAVPYPDYSVLKTPCKCANIMTSRGCPYRCSFCTTSRMFSPYRKRSVDSVIDEIKLYHKLGFKLMNFEDDNFTADRERAKEICRRIIAENLQFRETFFFGRTDMADDPELLDLLSQAHLTRVLIGIGSLNQAALDDINKHQSIEDIRRAGEACREHGIRVIASLVLGIDEDTPEDILRSVDFAKSIGAYQIQPAILTPFPGTPTYQCMIEEDRMITEGVEDWGLFDMTNVVFQPKKMSPWQLQDLFFEAGGRFYDFPSAFDIWKRFGPEYGLRRLYLATVTVIGVPLGRWVADNVDITPYYRVKHTPWKYGPEVVAQDEECVSGAESGVAAPSAVAATPSAAAVFAADEGSTVVSGASISAASVPSLASEMAARSAGEATAAEAPATAESHGSIPMGAPKSPKHEEGLRPVGLLPIGSVADFPAAVLEAGNRVKDAFKNVELPKLQ